MRASNFVIRTLEYGYKIPFKSFPPSFAKGRNNLSSLAYPDFVEKEIEDLLHFGFIKETKEPPFVINPLTVSDNGDKLRLILDCTHINEYIEVPKIKFDDLYILAQFIEKDDFMLKFDIKSGYHHIDIYPEHTKFLGFLWDFHSGIRYFEFLVLPFGLSSACHIFTKVFRTFVKKWRSVGMRSLIYIDDGICCVKGSALGAEYADIIQYDLLNSGAVINQPKSIWDPIRRMKFLGYIVCSNSMKFWVPNEKIDKIKNLIKSALSNKHSTARFIARIAGSIIALSLAIGPLSRLYSRCLYLFIESAPSWEKPIILPSNVIYELKFWLKNLHYDISYKIKGKHPVNKIVFSDASAHSYGGFILSSLGDIIARGTFTPSEISTCSTERELRAVLYILTSLKDKLRDQSILWHVDNSSTAKIIEVGSCKPYLNQIAVEIFEKSLNYGCQIHPLWIPREENVRADHISKIRDTDSWGIDAESFLFIQNKFGRFTFDRFADNLNCKTPDFSSRYYCPGTCYVNAFTENWAGHFNWICPPVSLISAALDHAKVCKAISVFLIPEWPSSYFWPKIIEKGGITFKSFVKGVLVLDPYYISSNEENESAIFKGFRSFRALAILVDFRY